MKYQILLCSICAFLFFSCKKEQKAPDNVQKYPVSFKVTGFSQSQVPIDGKAGKTKTAALATEATDSIPIQQLVYILFKEDELTPTTIRRFTKGDPNFGVISDNVPAGNYIATFTGGTTRLKVITSGDPTVPEGDFYLPYYFTYSTIHYPRQGDPNTWDDTFYKQVPITVTSTGISQSVAMDRITSKLDFVINDPIPAGTTKIVVAFNDTIGVDVKRKIAFKTYNPFINTTQQVISATDIGKTNYTISIFNLQNITPFDVTVSYYGANPNGPLNTKTIKNVVCKTNTRTILSGMLFTSSNIGFTIKVNQDWDTPLTVNF
jgi:hypothetical protein